jgi:hypothetical protein
VLLALLGTLPFLWMIHTQFSPTLLMVCLIARGAGQGAIGIPSVAAAYASVPKHMLPFATTATNIVQRLGGPIATTIMAIVMSLSATQFPSHRDHAFMLPFVALIVLQLLVLASASQLPVWVNQPNGEISNSFRRP